MTQNIISLLHVECIQKYRFMPFIYYIFGQIKSYLSLIFIVLHFIRIDGNFLFLNTINGLIHIYQFDLLCTEGCLTIPFTL